MAINIYRMDPDIVMKILKKLKSRNTRGINEGVKLSGSLWRRYIDEKFGIEKGDSATKHLARLVDELLALARDPDWRIKYAAIRGLSRISPSEEAATRIVPITQRLVESIRHDNGMVRRASVFALDCARDNFPDELYIQTYLVLQNLYDTEADFKKRRSLEQALDALYSPYLEDLLVSMGVKPMDEVAG